MMRAPPLRARAATPRVRTGGAIGRSRRTSRPDHTPMRDARESEDGEWRMEDGTRRRLRLCAPSSILGFLTLRQDDRLPGLDPVGIDLRVGGGDGLPLAAVAVARLGDGPEGFALLDRVPAPAGRG